MITLIATGHKENGCCNSHELYKIIELNSPEVIFEEIPASKFAAVYKGLLRDSIETYTIKKYLQNHPIAHYPVDLDTNEMSDIQFRDDVEKVFAIFNYHSPQYNDLLNQHGSLAERFGFPYLSSDQCIELLELKHRLEEQILQNIKLEKASQIYNIWLNFIDRRRNEMIKNIYSYWERNKYENALFLVGAEHRKPIMDKIQMLEKHNKPGLKWNFNYF